MSELITLLSEYPAQKIIGGSKILKNISGLKVALSSK